MHVTRLRMHVRDGFGLGSTHSEDLHCTVHCFTYECGRNEFELARALCTILDAANRQVNPTIYRSYCPCLDDHSSVDPVRSNGAVH